MQNAVGRGFMSRRVTVGVKNITLGNFQKISKIFKKTELFSKKRIYISKRICDLTGFA